MAAAEVAFSGLRRALGQLARRLLIAVLAILGAASFFVLLPLLHNIGGGPKFDQLLIPVAFVEPDAPEAEEEQPEPEKPPEEAEPPEPPPVDQPEVDLSTLSLDIGGGGTGGALASSSLDDIVRRVSENAAAQNSEGLSGDFDTQPQVKTKVPPVPPASARGGSVVVIFVVDEAGKVAKAQIEQSTNSALDEPVLRAIRRWTFEPGRRQGKPAPYRMRLPFTFGKD